MDLDFQPLTLIEIADAIDQAPGPDGRGLSATDRAAMFAFLDAPSKERWVAIHNIHVTRRHTVRVAVMRYCHLGLYAQPTPEQLASTLRASGTNAIRP